jgi:hypothetical protein
MLVEVIGRRAVKRDAKYGAFLKSTRNRQNGVERNGGERGKEGEMKRAIAEDGSLLCNCGVCALGNPILNFAPDAKPAILLPQRLKNPRKAAVPPFAQHVFNYRMRESCNALDRLSVTLGGGERGRKHVKS